MTRWWCSALVSLSLLGCGDDEGSSLSSNPESCATRPDPTVLTIENLTPAIDASVPNADITHGFTVVDPPALFESFQFRAGSRHTAGSVLPDNFIEFVITPDGDKHRYEATGNSWSMIGEVDLSLGRYELSDGSCYAFPEPLFRYQLTEPMGTGGMGGMGGTPSTGGAGGN